MVMDELKEYGIDYDTAMQRCVNNEALYLKLARKLPDMNEFDSLKQSIADKDLDSAFSYAHALKGIVSNLAITPLEEPIKEMTELLRARQDVDYSEYITKMDDAYTRLCEILSKED